VGNNPYLPANMMRTAMQPLFPKQLGIDSQMIANLRIKCRALLSSRDSPPNEVYEIPRIQADYLLSDAITPLPSLVAEVLDESKAPFLDQASLFARKELFNVLKESNCESKNLCILLKRLHILDSGFTYMVCSDSDGYFTAFCWMSPVQRQNFEIFGSTLFLDMMKHQTNSIMWPYTTVCAFNKMKQLVSCGEAFCCQE
jgi:hypothetical protein